MSIYCANCSHAKVKREKTNSSSSKYADRVRCLQGHWDNDRGYRNLYIMAEVFPPNPHSCKDYDSMGDELESFIDSLPNKTVWKIHWQDKHPLTHKQRHDIWMERLKNNFLRRYGWT